MNIRFIIRRLELESQWTNEVGKSPLPELNPLQSARLSYCYPTNWAHTSSNCPGLGLQTESVIYHSSSFNKQMLPQTWARMGGVACSQTQRGHWSCLQNELGWGAAKKALLWVLVFWLRNTKAIVFRGNKRGCWRNQALIESQKSVLVIFCLFGIQGWQSFSALAAVYT